MNIFRILEWYNQLKKAIDAAITGEPYTFPVSVRGRVYMVTVQIVPVGAIVAPSFSIVPKP